jgi:hypothetical protein
MSLDKEKVREVINAIYKFGNINKQYSGPVNEKVAQYVGMMVSELRRCSDGYGWIPQPPVGPASVAWIARTYTQEVINRLKEGGSGTSFSCARQLVYNLDRELHMVGLGLGV